MSDRNVSKKDDPNVVDRKVDLLANVIEEKVLKGANVIEENDVKSGNVADGGNVVVNVDVDEDREDPLVIDEAEDKSDGGDSDEKVNNIPLTLTMKVLLKGYPQSFY